MQNYVYYKNMVDNKNKCKIQFFTRQHFYNCKMLFLEKV